MTTAAAPTLIPLSLFMLNKRIVITFGSNLVLCSFLIEVDVMHTHTRKKDEEANHLKIGPEHNLFPLRSSLDYP